MKDKKIKILALFGKSGSGKNYIRDYLANDPRFWELVHCTTRPRRESDKDEDYWFVSKEHFFDMDKSGLFLEKTCFNDWWYGTLETTPHPELINVGIFNIKAINQLLKNDTLDVLPVCIYRRSKDRILGAIDREHCTDEKLKEICRRFLADEEDFSHINFNYVTYENYNEDIRILNIPEIKNFIFG